MRLGTTILCGAIVLGFVTRLAAQRIERTSSDAVLRLPPPMEAAMRKFDSTFGPRRLSDYATWHYYYPCPAPPDCAVPWYKITERQALFAAIGDFNRDGTLDLVVDGDNNVEGVRLAVLSQGAAYRVERIEPLELLSPTIREFRKPPRTAEEAELGVSQGLAVRGPGRVTSEFEEEPLILTTDAFIAHYFEKAGSLYYYRDGKWHRYHIID